MNSPRLGDGLDPLRRRADHLEARLKQMDPRAKAADFDRKELAALRRIVGHPTRPKFVKKPDLSKTQKLPEFEKEVRGFFPQEVVKGFRTPRFAPGIE